MSKRFSDTDLWDKEWFMALNPTRKCLVQYIFSKCDQAGVWSPNWILASSFIGAKVSIKDLDALKKHFEILESGKVFVLDFIAFQYGELSEKCPPHKKVIGLLKKHGLFERVLLGYQYPTGRVQEEEEDKEEEKEEETETEKEEEGEARKPARAFRTYAVIPWDTETFKAAWLTWKTYKLQQHKFQYKGDHSEQAALIKLTELSGGVEATAVAIIHQSIANGWSGLFKIKEDKNGSGANNSKQPTGANVNSKSAFAKIDAMYGTNGAGGQ